MRILIIGGSGGLGTVIKEYLDNRKIEYEAPSHNELDICKTDLSIWDNFSHILLLAADKNQSSIELNSSNAINVNIKGVANIVDSIIRGGHKTKLVYISTEYVYKGNKGYYKEKDGVYPCNKYAWSKLGGECAVRMLDDYLIIRCGFYDNAWAEKKTSACINQFSSREHIKITGEKIVNLIVNGAEGVYNIGGARRSIWEIVSSITQHEVLKVRRDEIPTLFTIPKDTSMNTKKYDALRRKNGNLFYTYTCKS
jgi:dTDP-4-dehydrorhamnose reductase